MLREVPKSWLFDSSGVIDIRTEHNSIRGPEDAVRRRPSVLARMTTSIEITGYMAIDGFLASFFFVGTREKKLADLS
jgi:hypothetical protein